MDVLTDLICLAPVALFRWRVTEDFPVEFTAGDLGLGYSADDFLSGRVAWVAITHPDDEERLRREVGACLNNGIDHFSNRYRLRTSEGDYVWMHDWNRVTRSPDGTPELIDSVVIRLGDVLAADELSQLMLESPLYGICIVQDDTVAYVNETLGHLVGLSASDLVGASYRRLLDALSAEDRERVEAFCRARMAGESASSRYEVRQPTGDSVRWLEVSARQARFHGRPALHMVVSDVTVRKDAEEALCRMQAELDSTIQERTAQLEESNRHLRLEIERREEAEVATEDARHYLETLIATSHDGILVVDAEGRFEFANESCLRIFGYPRGEFIGAHFIAMVPPDMHPFIMARWREVQAGTGAPYEVDILAGGVERRSLLVSHRHMDIAGARKYCVVVKDVSERKQAGRELADQQAHLERLVVERTHELQRVNKELLTALAARDGALAALEQSEANFRAIADNAQEAILISGADNRALYVNAFACEMVGVPRDSQVGVDTTEFVLPADRDRVRRYTQMRLAGEPVPQPYEATLVARDGRRIVVKITGAATVWRGRPATIGMLRDVTARKRSEQELSYERMLLELGQSVARMGSWSIDLPDGRITWSKELYRIMGVDPKTYDLQRVRGADLVHPQDLDMVAGEVDAATREQRGTSFDSRAIRPDGTVCETLTTMEFVPGNAYHPDRLVGVATDITERRRLERDMLEAAQREQQRVGQELHDTLGQELAGIAFLAKALEREVRSLSPSAGNKARQLAELSRQSVGQCRRIAHELAPATIEAGRLGPEIERLCAGTQELYGIPCETETADVGDRCDSRTAAHVYQVAREALMNAMRHAHPGRVRIEIRDHGRFGELTVSDDGTWRPPADAGEGLGLRAMRHRAEIVGGSLSIRHGDDQPTRVICRFPLAAAPDV